MIGSGIPNLATGQGVMESDNRVLGAGQVVHDDFTERSECCAERRGHLLELLQQ